MPSSSARALVVSLHDVSPHTHAECVSILSGLRRLGVGGASLLVIPDHHRRGLVTADAKFCEWLQEMEIEGHEIVTHGFYHARERRCEETLTQRLMTRIYTADEGEFYDLDRASAKVLISRGNEELARAGVHPSGFIAPAWLLGVEAEEALRELGVEYTTRLSEVLAFKPGGRIQSQSLVWSVRSAWRRQVSLAWNALLFRRLQNAPLMRISIHPVDLRHSRVWQQITDLITRALCDRGTWTYQTFLRRESLRVS